MSYQLSRFPFVAAVRRALEEEDLQALRAPDASVWTRATDQSSEWHRRFYRNFDEWRTLYERFVRWIVATHIREPAYFQAVPTVRLHLPGNVAVGEFHTDRDYGHPAGEFTFWVPITHAYGTNSLLLEASPGSGEYLRINARPGDVIVFEGGTVRHGSVVNTTGQSRVSFDFRCLPVRRFKASSERSVNAGLRFVPGEYFAPQPIRG